MVDIDKLCLEMEKYKCLTDQRVTELAKRIHKLDLTVNIVKEIERSIYKQMASKKTVPAVTSGENSGNATGSASCNSGSKPKRKAARKKACGTKRAKSKAKKKAPPRKKPTGKGRKPRNSGKCPPWS